MCVFNLHTYKNGLLDRFVMSYEGISQKNQFSTWQLNPAAARCEMRPKQSNKPLNMPNSS